ncbi:MAG: NADH-quinone oxidoreductase subunit J [Thermoplasmataceae archaeon]
MNRKSSALASALFFLVFLVQLLKIGGDMTLMTQNIGTIGTLLFTEYLIPFELISVILVGGIIGMLYVSGGD